MTDEQWARIKPRSDAYETAKDRLAMWEAGIQPGDPRERIENASLGRRLWLEMEQARRDLDVVVRNVEAEGTP